MAPRLFPNITPFVLLLLLGTGFPHGFLFANGGDQRVVDGKYLINLARAPFTPRVGEKISMLISFVDIPTHKLISEDLIAKIRIAKLGGRGAQKRTFLFEQDGIRVSGGVLELPYTFAETGLHEVFIDFALASNAETVFSAPDFLLDVRPYTREPSHRFAFIGIAIGLIGGFIIGWRLRQKVSMRI